MTLGEVWRARRQGEGWCTAWVFATAGGTRRPVAMIARHPEYGHPGPGVVKLDHSLRSVQPWHDQRTDKRAGMSFVVRNFAALPDGLVQADSFATGVGLGFVSEDVQVVRRRGICTYGFGRCRTYAGAFTAMWKVPELQSHGYGGGPDAIAVPELSTSQ